MEGAALEPLLPRDVPVRVAVAGLEGARRVDDPDDVADVAQVEEPDRVAQAHADAAVADVGETLVGRRPRGGVHELAAPGDAHRVGHIQPVVVRVALGDADGRGVHHLEHALLEDNLDAVAGQEAGLARRDGDDPGHLVVAPHREGVTRDVDGAHHRGWRLEGDRAVLEAPDLLRSLHATQPYAQGDLVVGGPVSLRSVVHLSAGDPAPGAVCRLAAGDEQPSLDGGPVGDRLVEPHDDRHADPDGRPGQRRDARLERALGLEGGEVRAALRALPLGSTALAVTL